MTWGLLLLAAASQAAPPTAQTTPTAVPAQDPSVAVDQIVAVTLPAPAFLDALARAYDKGFREHTSAALAPLEARHPGVTERVRVDAGAELRRMMVGNLPALMRELRRIHLDNLSSAEIVDLRDFYATPTGRRMAQAALQGATDRSLRDVGRVDLATARQNAFRSAVDRQLDGLSADDLPVVTAFAKTDAARKLPELQPLLQRAVQGWTASMNGSGRVRLNAAIDASIRRYVVARPAKGSGK